jgi:hypothetical protein
MNPFEQAVCDAALSDQSLPRNRELVAFWIRYQERDEILTPIQPFVISWPPASYLPLAAPLDSVNEIEIIDEPATIPINDNPSPTIPPSNPDSEINLSTPSDFKNFTKSATPDQFTEKSISSTINQAQSATAHTHGIQPFMQISQTSQFSLEDVDFIVSGNADSGSSLKLISDSNSSTQTKTQTKTAHCTKIQSAIHEDLPPSINLQDAIITDSEIVYFSAYSHGISVSNLSDVSVAQQTQVAPQTNSNDSIHASTTGRSFSDQVRSAHPHDISLSTQSLHSSIHIQDSNSTTSSNSTTPLRNPARDQMHVKPNEEGMAAKSTSTLKTSSQEQQIQINSNFKEMDPARDQMHVNVPNTGLTAKSTPTSKNSFYQSESLPPEFKYRMIAV